MKSFILAGAYEISEEFSADVVRLIKHMLTVDPRQRATTSDILNDPWFLVDLPANLFAPVTHKISDAALDGRVIEEASEV